MENVEWKEAQSYCQDVGGRLPTEAEWEYAARAGSTVVRYGNLDQILWYSVNSEGRPHEVGQKQPNAFGLYDMLGNEWQWTADWYGENYYKATERVDPVGPPDGKFRSYLNRCRAYGSLISPSMISHSIEDCDKAIQLKQGFAEAYHYRGRAYAAQQLFQRAIQDYDEALRLEPGSGSIYTDRGFLYAAQNKPDLAIKEYDELIRIKPNDWYSYFARAREYNRQHRPELAIPDCNESIRLNSGSFLSYAARGDAHRFLGQHDLAIQDYDQAIRLQPGYTEFYAGRAAAKESLGDKTGAAADRQRAQELRK